MIDKLIHIKNYGTFKNFSVSKATKWDGRFKKNNIIYAPNGSGKTSLALMFSSLKDDDEIVLKKQSFGSSNSPDISLLVDNGKVDYKNAMWSMHIPSIEVFDSFYMEENMYSITIEDNPDALNIFELNCGSEILAIKQELECKREELKKLSSKIKNIKTTNRKLETRKTKNSVKKQREELLNESLEAREKIYEQIKRLEKQIETITEDNLKEYVNAINKYLSMFCDTMRIETIKRVKNNRKLSIVYELSINGYVVTFATREQLSLRYCLSDGDKNALSLSFFLARFDMIPNKENYIVVIDDPFTSFDSQRKSTTISQLSSLASKVQQFFLLTHDIHFADDFIRRNSGAENLSLQISPEETGSKLRLSDYSTDVLTGFCLDIKKLRQFNKSPKDDQLTMRDVKRCIRPALEGIFRVKFADCVNDTEWLGDFLKKIRQADADSPLFRIKPIYDEMSDINDYSKDLHHSNPTHTELMINCSELKQYVKRTLALIDKI